MLNYIIIVYAMSVLNYVFNIQVVIFSYTTNHINDQNYLHGVHNKRHKNYYKNYYKNMYDE